LIFDQVDVPQLSRVEKTHLVVATQARNSASFHAIVLVSNAHTMEKILHLNGGIKIFSAFSAKHFQFNKNQITSLVDKLLGDRMQERKAISSNEFRTSIN
jgi:uncharacterized surface protein with fasciclin (FAS1) repeats